jgi:hypothetical protein
MGWGMGIGIGWPNASAQGVPEVMGYFYIIDRCDGGSLPIGSTTQLVSTSFYSTGNYVRCDNFSTRVLLGTIAPEISPDNYEISGEVFNSCPV